MLPPSRNVPILLLPSFGGRSLLRRRRVSCSLGSTLRLGALWFAEQHHLFSNPGLVFIVCADYTLHQVMTYDVPFIEVHKCQSFHAFQNVNCFQQSTAPG